MASNDVEVPSAQYIRQDSLRKLPKTLMGGTRAMRAAAEEYLPPEPGEETAGVASDYARRLGVSTLFPAYSRAMSTLSGKVFSRPLQLAKDVPEPIEVMAENVDLRGTGLHTFAYQTFFDALATGISYILVDMPELNAGPIVSREDERGRRPFWVQYGASDLIGYRTAVADGSSRLTQARLRETFTVPDGDYGEETRQRIRVFFAEGESIEYEVWEEPLAGGALELVQERRSIRGVNRIPLVPVYGNPDHSFFSSDPAFLDLAYLNVADWQMSSDLRNIEHVANVPVVYISGTNADKFSKVLWGPMQALLLPEGSTAGYVEHSGHAIGELKRSIETNRHLMRLLSLEPLLKEESGNITATESSIRGAEAHSTLQAIALMLQDSLEQAIDLTGQWMGLGVDASGSVQVNTKWVVSNREAADLTALQQMRLAGDLSRETLWAELQRRDVLSDEFDAVAEDTAIRTEGPALGMLGREDEDGEDAEVDDAGSEA